MMRMAWWTDQRVSKVNNLYTIKNILVNIGELLERPLSLTLLGNKIYIGLLETIRIMLHCG